MDWSGRESGKRRAAWGLLGSTEGRLPRLGQSKAARSREPGRSRTQHRNGKRSLGVAVADADADADVGTLLVTVVHS